MHPRISNPIGRSNHAHAQLYCAITTVQYGPILRRSDMGKILLQEYQVHNIYRPLKNVFSSFRHNSYCPLHLQYVRYQRVSSEFLRQSRVPS